MNELSKMTRAGESILVRDLARRATECMDIDPFTQKGVQPTLFDKSDFVEGLSDPQAN